MRTLFLSILFWGFCVTPASAYRLLENLDFASGDWTLIGVPMHNYKQLPVQQELGTFILSNVSLMQSLQDNWDFDMTLDDKCDYHYSLKFYRDGNLVRTLDLNLFCGYITYEGLSYTFDPSEFERIRQQAAQVPWSRITFGDLEVLKTAIQTLDRTSEVFWYEDVQQYTYPGFFMISIDGLPWQTDRDSLKNVVEQTLMERLSSSDFYLQEYFHVIREDQVFVRYLVNCESDLADRLDRGVYLSWRSHLHNRDSVSILAIGIDERKYRRLMKQD